MLMKSFILLALTMGMQMLVNPTQVEAKESKAYVTLSPTMEGSTISGEAFIVEENDGVTVDIRVMQAPPGSHGLHFHENSSCDDEGKAAGGHFNPNNVDHGYLPKDGHNHAHAGDMGNIEVGEDGTGHMVILLPQLTIDQGDYALLGRSIILHEKLDDFGQPTGNAGGRIACGIVKVQE